MSTFSGFLMEGELSEPKLPEVDVESIVKDEDVQAAYEENFVEAAARVSAEAQVNWNKIMEACTITEFACLESTGQEFLYEAGNLSAFFEKVKAFFKNLWQKIQSIFKKAAMQFNAMISNDKDFLNKYKKTINSAINSELKKENIEVDIYKDYVFLTREAEAICGSGSKIADKDSMDNAYNVAKVLGVDINGISSEAWEKAAKEITEDVVSDKVDEYRAKLIKVVDSSYSSSDASDKEFKSDLVNALRGSDSKDSVAIKEAASTAVSFLEKSSKLKSSLNTMLKQNKKEIDKALTDINKLEKDLNKDMSKNDEGGKTAGSKHTVVTKGIQLLKSQKTIYATFSSTILQELKNCSKQCKSVCVKVVSSAKHEAATVTSEGSMSLLDGLDLI